MLNVLLEYNTQLLPRAAEGYLSLYFPVISITMDKPSTSPSPIPTHDDIYHH